MSVQIIETGPQIRRLDRNRRFPGAVWLKKSGGFTPASLSSLTAWWRADLGVTGSSPVSSWRDQSGAAIVLSSASGPTLQATGGPNNTAAIFFASGSTTPLLSGNASVITGAATIYVIHKVAAINAAYNPVQFGQVTKISLGYAISGGLVRQLTQGASSQHDTAAATTNWELWIYQTQIGGNAQALRVNGSAETLSASIAQATPDTTSILLTCSSTATMDYSIAELIVQNKNASAADISNVESYMLARYGL